MPSDGLPAGLTQRPLSFDDLQSVFEVHHADQTAALGEANVELADIQSFWQRPSFDLTTSSVGIFEGDQLIASAELYGADRARAAVSPAHHGRGIGTWLARWLSALSVERGGERLGMPVPVGSPGDRLLAGLGFGVRWTSWVLELPAGTNVPERTLPDGYTVREANPTEWAALHKVIDDAFLEWADRESEPYSDFVGEIIKRPGFEPWHLRAAFDAEGTLVGGAVLMMVLGDAGEPIDGFVDMLGVRPDQRNRGLAQSLLGDAFSAAFAHGAPKGSLATDSRTGALGLYEKVGMSVVQTWVHRAGLTGQP